jgi:VWFA-related protein
MGLLRSAARQLFERLRPGDRAAVRKFQSTLTLLTDWTSDREALDRAVAAVNSSGGTALYTAIYVALKKISTDSADEAGWRRRVIVVLSDGFDTRGPLSYDDVLEACRRSSTLIYTVRVEDPPEPTLLPVPRKSEYMREKNPKYVMSTLARESGARALLMTRIEDLPGLFTQIAVELRHQYLLGYATPPDATDGAAFRLVDVSVPGVAGAQARTRRGYYPLGGSGRSIRLPSP